MTKPVVCHEGKCKEKEREFLDECVNCDVVETIEHELLKESAKETRR